MPLAPGSVLAGTIRLDRPLGRGAGSGAWIGRHLRLRIDVVVKLVAGEQAELAARIGGPHVVRLLDLGVTPEGLPYVVRELLEGESLDARLARAGPMSLAEVAALVEQAARGLGRGHKLGVVHRRLRPAKIFLD
ncbi:MAG: serine/threonine protein kinase, partial [Deltaproteobacteria bacterium]|nr:serine/threonine protein kinase [Deltaproteobacteria bacterium]